METQLKNNLALVEQIRAACLTWPHLRFGQIIFMLRLDEDVYYQESATTLEIVKRHMEELSDGA